MRRGSRAGTGRSAFFVNKKAAALVMDMKTLQRSVKEGQRTDYAAR
jgi:hypothetical protein